MKQKNTDIQYIGVPFCSGTNRNGAQYSPNYFLEHLQPSNDDFLMLQFVHKNVPSGSVAYESVNNYFDVVLMKNTLINEMRKAINNNKTVIVLGGDHSISIGSIAGVLDKFRNLGVIWFDAHTDINTEETSPSGNAHGMPLASLIGLCETGINCTESNLNPKNIFWIGVRDIDDGEWVNIRKLGIEDNVFTCEMVHTLGMGNVMQYIQGVLKQNGVEQLHLSFDIDVMDPSIVEATGTSVPNGLTECDCDIFLSNLFNVEMPPVVSIDFVEYNPLLDNNNLTGIWCMKILKRIRNLLSN